LTAIGCSTVFGGSPDACPVTAILGKLPADEKPKTIPIPPKVSMLRAG